MKLSSLLDKKNNNLDLIRILLSISVILGHSYALNGSGGYWIDPIRQYFVYTNSGPLAVKIFLFISGLVVTNSYILKRSATYFLISRFFRILPGLFFVLLITVFIFGPLLTIDNNYWNHLNYFIYIRYNIVFYTYHLLPGVFENNLYPNIINGSLWSLRYEVGSYFILLISFILIGTKNKFLLLIPICLVFIDFLFLDRIILCFIENNSDKYLLPIFFSYGVLFAVFSNYINVNFYFVILSIVLFLIFRNSNYEEIVLAFMMCNVLLYLSTLKWILKLKPKYDISYGIYLWGFLIQQTIFNYYGHIYIGFHFLISVLISVIFALLTYVLIEKPFMQLGKKIYDYNSNLINI